MWRLGRRPAAGPRDRLQGIGRLGIRLHEAVRHQVGYGVDARTRKGGNVIAAVIGLERLHVEADFQDGEPAEARERQRKCSQAAHAERIAAPGENDDRNQRDGAQRDDDAQRRENREQESDGVGIDDHQIDEIRRHHQHLIFELREQHQQADHDQRQRPGDGRTPYHREPKKIEKTPGKRKCRHHRERGLGRNHDGKSGGVRNEHERGSPNVSPIPRAASRRSRINRRTRMAGARARP